MIKNSNKNLLLDLSKYDIIDLSILCNIHSIKFGYKFNQSINNLPNLITH
jgi:hypothetical protein